MCKSQAEGGQRCAGHARTRVETMIAKGEESVARYERGEITKEEAQAHHAKVHDAMVDYASTLEGAADYRADAAEAQALADQTRDPEDEFVAAHLRNLVDEGAQRAQVNREVENAYRASQGQPPLTTPVPQTFAQEAEAQVAAEKAAAEKAAKDADPFGLRAAATTADTSKGFAVETTFDAPNRLPQRPPATTGEWTFQSNDVPPTVITPENGHGYGNPDNHYRLSTGLGVSPQELQRISDDALETSGYGQALRDAGLLAPKAATTSSDGRGFNAEAASGAADADQRRHTQTETLAGRPTVHGNGPVLNNVASYIGEPMPPVKGFRARREQRAYTNTLIEYGERDYGQAYLDAITKYEGRFDEKQVSRAAFALKKHALAQHPDTFYDADGLRVTADEFANRYAATNLDVALSVASS